MRDWTNGGTGVTGCGTGVTMGLWSNGVRDWTNGGTGVTGCGTGLTGCGTGLTAGLV